MIIKLMNVATYGHDLNYTILPTFGIKDLKAIFATHDDNEYTWETTACALAVVVLCPCTHIPF